MNRPNPKALFIPLKTEHFEAFQRGDKHAEYRIYGSRWNERTCTVGRPVTISKGYGKRARISGTVTKFDRVNPRTLGELLRIALLNCFGSLDRDIAVISIVLDGAAQ